MRLCDREKTVTQCICSVQTSPVCLRSHFMLNWSWWLCFLPVCILMQLIATVSLACSCCRQQLTQINKKTAEPVSVRIKVNISHYAHISHIFWPWCVCLIVSDPQTSPWPLAVSFIPDYSAAVYVSTVLESLPTSLINWRLQGNNPVKCFFVRSLLTSVLSWCLVVEEMDGSMTEGAAAWWISVSCPFTKVESRFNPVGPARSWWWTGRISVSPFSCCLYQSDAAGQLAPFSLFSLSHAPELITALVGWCKTGKTSSGTKRLKGRADPNEANKAGLTRVQSQWIMVHRDWTWFKSEFK